MTSIAFVTSFWDDAEDARKKGEGPFGLKSWRERIQHYFSPDHIFIAAGTWSDPKFSPLPYEVPVINSGVEKIGDYDPWYNQYSACAYTAAYAYALNIPGWDICINLDNEILVGAVDFDSLLTEFMQREEELLEADWHGRPGGMMFLKRKGASRFLHERRRANIIENRSGQKPMLVEDEIGEIFKGRWWNPWPHIQSIRQDFKRHPQDAQKRIPEVFDWPFVSEPHPQIVERYIEEQQSKSKPLTKK